jgi:predicted permease
MQNTRVVEFLLAHWRLAALGTLFFIGVGFRRSGWAGPEHGRKLLAFVMNFALPPLIFGALGGTALEREYALLPIAAVLVMLLMWGSAVFVARRLKAARVTEGAMVMCSLSMNISMVYPFAALGLSAHAFSQLVMFDMGHAVMVWTFSSVLACKYGGHTDDIPVLLKRSLSAAPLWALLIALVLNLSAAPVPPKLYGTSLLVGQVLVLIVPFAMGLLVSARGIGRRDVSLTVILRSVAGGLVGLALAFVLGLEGSAAGVVVLGAAAPVGFVAVVLSSREELDLELAASAAAISVFLASLWLPVAMLVVAH